MQSQRPSLATCASVFPSELNPVPRKPRCRYRSCLRRREEPLQSDAPQAAHLHREATPACLCCHMPLRHRVAHLASTAVQSSVNSGLHVGTAALLRTAPAKPRSPCLHGAVRTGRASLPMLVHRHNAFGSAPRRALELMPNYRNKTVLDSSCSTECRITITPRLPCTSLSVTRESSHERKEWI